VEDGKIDEIIRLLREEVKKWNVPIVTEISRRRDPFRVLISTVISLRTKDDVTRSASMRLFKEADTPEKMLLLDEERIAELIYPAGFYRKKAKNIREICTILLDKYQGRVPDSVDELLKFHGVGRKTANLVVTLGYGKQGICVDTHVHRISNRLGFVKTKTPEQTEMALREKLAGQYWIEYNDLLVTYGQHVCTPVSPHCSLCRIFTLCDRVGVAKSR